MKSSLGTVVAGAAVIGTGLLLGFNSSFAQNEPALVEVKAEPAPIEGLEWIPSPAVPPFGTFYFLQKLESNTEPPWPFNPFPLLPVYALDTNGTFLVDDRAVNYDTLSEDVEAHKALQMAEAQYGLETPVVPELGIYGESGGMMLLSEVPPPPCEGEGCGGGSTNWIEGYASYGSNDFWLEITAVSNGVASFTLHGTAPDVVYELQSKGALTNGGWVAEGIPFLGAAGQDWTPATVSVGSRTNLFLRARSWTDTDGDGLPDWWEAENGLDPNNPDTGNTGVPDGYRNSAGDGWSNIEKYERGWSLSQFCTPSAPSGLTVTVVAAGPYANLSWNPARGNVTGYTIERSFTNTASQLSSSVTSFSDSQYLLPTGLFWYWRTPAFRMRADYAAGNSEWTSWTSPEEYSAPLAGLGSAQDGQISVAVSGVPTGAAMLRVGQFRLIGNEYYSVTNFDAAVSTITNGSVRIRVPYSVQTNHLYWYVRWVSTNGIASAAVSHSTFEPKPFWDGREQLRQNLAFLLRAPGLEFSFAYTRSNAPGSAPTYVLTPSEYASAGLYDVDEDAGFWWSSLNEFRPFEQNYFYRNFVVNLTNAVNWIEFYQGRARWVRPVGYEFHVALPYMPAYQFQPPSTVTPIPGLLGANDPPWIFWPMFEQLGWSPAWDMIGIAFDEVDSFVMVSGARNYFGLPYASACLAYLWTNGIQFETLVPGGSILAQDGCFFPATAQPAFQTVDYYFARPDEDLLPGYDTFSVTNQTPLLITSIGQIFQLAGYAKLAILNGYTDKFAYLGQYFDTAYKMGTNGMATTNQTGILSPYGEFFPTEPGPTALVTLPWDTNSVERGTAVVHVVKLQLDVNHDGVMDTSWTGPDNTSQARPLLMWVNNDFDRGHYVDGSDWEEDDLKQAGIPDYPTLITPDYAYATYAPFQQPTPRIPSMRDLEDYTRLWMPGLSALRAAMPSNYTARLTLAGNGQMRIFRAVESDGGTNYLFDELTASNQVAQSGSLFVGLLISGSPINLTSLTNLSEHFIWCGAQRGSAEVHLQILDGTNMVADTAAYIEIKDIKEMYERWTLGDVASRGPYDYAYPAAEDLPVGTTSFQYGPSESTNTPYILFVHGWNMERWEKDRFAETAFKRLYWQGYQGRFGSFRWPTDNGFTGLWDAITDRRNYDNSEFNAWKSAPLLTAFVRTNLNVQYPGHVYLLAHSMGNVVASEALRLATNQIVNTYIASQAAIPAHTYDGTLAPYSFTYLGLSYGPRCPNLYSNWCAPNTSGVEQRVNFYNVNDYALQRPRWELNQLLKPDQATTLGWTYIFDGYPHDNIQSYTNTLDDTPPWDHFQKEQGLTRIYFNIVSSMTDRYEVMSYAAQSRSTALGRTANVGNLERNVDLARSTPTRIWPPDTQDQAPNEYSRHKWHSAEFRSTNMRQKGYWQTLLSEEGFDIAP